MGAASAPAALAAGEGPRGGGGAAGGPGEGSGGGKGGWPFCPRSGYPQAGPLDRKRHVAGLGTSRSAGDPRWACTRVPNRPLPTTGTSQPGRVCADLGFPPVAGKGLPWAASFITRSFTHSFIHSLIHSCTYLFICSLIHSFTHLCTHSFTYSLIHLFILGHSHPLQYPCLENPMDRGASWAAVHGVTSSRARLSSEQLLTHSICARSLA